MKYTSSSPEMRLFYENMLIEFLIATKFRFLTNPTRHPCPHPSPCMFLLWTSMHTVQGQRIEVVIGKKGELVMTLAVR